MGWARLDDNRHDHTKILNLGGDVYALAAVGLLDHAITWASRHRNESKTPGLVPWSFWQQRGGKHATRLTGLLLREGLVDTDKDDRGVWIHDFENYGPKRSSTEASEAGKKGAAARWQKPSESLSNSHAEPIANDASRAAAPAFPTRPVPSEVQVQEPRANVTRIRTTATMIGSTLLAEHYEGVSTPNRVKQRMGEVIDEMIAEGFDPDVVREALARLRKKPNGGPGLLPSIVGDVMADRSPRRRSESERMFG
jgi:hypothetical protein